MLSNEVLSWYKQYFFTSMNREYEEPKPEMEQEITKCYERLFLKPMKTMCGVQIPTPGEISKKLTTVRANGLLNPLHYLIVISDRMLQTVSDIQDLGDRMTAAVDYVLENSQEEWFTAKDSTKPFIGYTSVARKPLVKFPVKVIALGRTKQFKNGLSLSSLAAKDPSRLRTCDITALRRAVDIGFLQASDLATCKYPIIIDGKCDMVTVNALYDKLPSYYVRRLLNSLSDVYKREAPTPYHAALEYAEEHEKEYTICLKELRQLVSECTIPDKVTVELNDEIVAEYIHKKYGIPIDDIKESVFTPTVEKLYTSSYFLDEESQNMSAEEFVEKVQEDPASVTGTLDELVLAACNQLKFDTNHTIAELVAFLNDEEMPAKATLQEQVKAYKEANGLSGDTTLDEFISQTKHKFVDDAEVAMSLINSCDNISLNMKAAIRKGITTDEFVDFPSVHEHLRDYGLSEESIKVIDDSVKLGTPIVLKGAISEDDVLYYLIQTGIPRTVAAQIVDGVVPNDSSERSDASIEKTVSENQHSERLDDVGYKAAESLLFDMRKSISESDSDELRTEMLPIIYSYMRILMMSAGDSEDVLEFLESKKQECKGKAVDYLNTAIELMRK